MPDTRSHRGAHGEDAQAFAARVVPVLQTACSELSWLLTRGYSEHAALTLVGDHHQLSARQRSAVRRAACDDRARARRRAHALPLASLAGSALVIDGFNCLITVEAMLSGAPVFRGRDGALRDLASVHGTYRKVEETLPALAALRRTLEHAGVARADLLLDRPVSNSGRLRTLIEHTFAESACAVDVTLADAVDPLLVAEMRPVASSDSAVLDRAAHWVDLPGAVAAHERLDPWLVDLSVLNV